MPSDIDEAVPADNVKADKALIRANFAAAKSEIEELQENTSLAMQMALGIVSL